MDDLTQEKAYELFKREEFLTYQELITHYAQCIRETRGRALAAESAAQFNEIIAETKVLCEAFLFLRGVLFPVAEVFAPAVSFRTQQANQENSLRHQYVDQLDAKAGPFFLHCERQFQAEDAAGE